MTQEFLLFVCLYHFSDSICDAGEGFLKFVLSYYQNEIEVKKVSCKQ